ncbi:MAG: hypothetical protein ACTMHU_10880, partial [Cellulosimicrobium funkei]
RAVVAKTVLDGVPCLKLTLLNPTVTLADVRHVLDLVRTTAQALVERDELLHDDDVATHAADLVASLATAGAVTR